MGMLIGAGLLDWGSFTRNGPEKTWEWRLDERSMGTARRIQG